MLDRKGNGSCDSVASNSRSFRDAHSAGFGSPDEICRSADAVFPDQIADRNTGILKKVKFEIVGSTNR
jgi:hypothetical protein